ncbi:MAG: hypothetical protein ACRC92_20285 [Peptostreptococcaceae bacterium]
MSVIIETENSYIQTSKILDQYLEDGQLIGTKTFKLTVDTDQDTQLDLEQDLHFCRWKCNIKKVEGFSNIGGSIYLRNVPKGESSVTFTVTGVVERFPTIYRPKINGLKLILEEVGDK